MGAIKDIKEKKKRSDEDNILEKIISAGEHEIKDKDAIEKILSYAADMAYINKSRYGNHNTYSINAELIDGKECSHCGEKIISFNCQNFNINTSPQFVNTETFEQLAIEVFEIKQFLINKNAVLKHSENSSQTLLEQEVERFKNQSIYKDKLIFSLQEQLAIANKTISRLQNTTNNSLNSWENVARKNSNTTNLF